MWLGDDRGRQRYGFGVWACNGSLRTSAGVARLGFGRVRGIQGSG